MYLHPIWGLHKIYSFLIHLQFTGSSLTTVLLVLLYTPSIVVPMLCYIRILKYVVRTRGVVNSIAGTSRDPGVPTTRRADKYITFLFISIEFLLLNVIPGVIHANVVKVDDTTDRYIFLTLFLVLRRLMPVANFLIWSFGNREIRSGTFGDSSCFLPLKWRYTTRIISITTVFKLILLKLNLHRIR